MCNRGDRFSTSANYYTYSFVSRLCVSTPLFVLVARARACVRACVCVCVCERERERRVKQTYRQTDRQRQRQTQRDKVCM